MTVFHFPSHAKLLGHIGESNVGSLVFILELHLLYFTLLYSRLALLPCGANQTSTLHYHFCGRMLD